MPFGSSVALWIKICGITRAEDALMVEGAGADALGLIFAPDSPRFVDMERAGEICASVSSGIRKVGVFVRPEWERISGLIDRLPLDIVQWHGGPLSQEGYDRLSALGLPWIHAVRWDGSSPVEEPAGARWILVEGRSEKAAGGTGVSWNYAALSSRTLSRPFLLSGGLGPSTVEKALASLGSNRPFGVDVSSGVEISPGVKSREKVEEFVSNVRSFGERS